MDQSASFRRQMWMHGSSAASSDQFTPEGDRFVALDVAAPVLLDDDLAIRVEDEKRLNHPIEVGCASIGSSVAAVMTEINDIDDIMLLV